MLAHLALFQQRTYGSVAELGPYPSTLNTPSGVTAEQVSNNVATATEVHSSSNIPLPLIVALSIVAIIVTGWSLFRTKTRQPT